MRKNEICMTSMVRKDYNNRGLTPMIYLIILVDLIHFILVKNNNQMIYKYLLKYHWCNYIQDYQQQYNLINKCYVNRAMAMGQIKRLIQNVKRVKAKVKKSKWYVKVR